MALLVVVAALPWQADTQIVGGAFQAAAYAFLAAAAICGMGFLPLLLLILVLAGLGERFARYEKSWGAVLVESAAVSLISGLGFVVAVTPFVHSWQWHDNAATCLVIAAGSFFGLVSARWLHPDLGPGAYAPPFRPAQFPKAAVGAAVLIGVAVTVLSAVIPTSMELDCVDGDSCTEVVRVRGLPYPFIRRSFDPAAFGYDVQLVALGSLVAFRLRELRARRRSAGLAPAG